MANHSAVDGYVARSERWPDAIRALRPLLLDCGLDEELKWGKPCYRHGGKNIAIIQEMKGFLALMFFKGVLLEDPDGILQDVGPNSRSARRVCFRSADEVTAHAASVRSLVDRAVAVEEEGLEIESAPEADLVAELQRRLDADPELRAGFESLTPGRRREYNLHIGGAKRAETREKRIDQHVERIRAGKGLRDR